MDGEEGFSTDEVFGSRHAGGVTRVKKIPVLRRFLIQGMPRNHCANGNAALETQHMIGKHFSFDSCFLHAIPMIWDYSNCSTSPMTSLWQSLLGLNRFHLWCDFHSEVKHNAGSVDGLPCVQTTGFQVITLSSLGTQ